MMKKIIVLFLFLFTGLVGFCATVPVMRPAITSPAAYTSFENCTKMYSGEVDKTFIVLLAAISAQNHKIIELQSKTAAVLFKANTGKEFWVNVSRVDAKSVMIKITPADNSYAFASAIVNSIFQYITANINK